MATPANQTAAFSVRLSAVLRVKPFISTEETRYYLNGVYIDACAEGGALCVATDGHRLGVQREAEGLVNTPTIVRVPNELKLPPKLLSSPWLVGISTGDGRGHISVVEAAGNRDEDTAEAAIQRVEDCTLRIGRAFIDGTFPNWRRVVPTKGDKDTVRAFNADYIKGFGKHLVMTGADEMSPHLVQLAGEPDFIGVLMPLRSEAKSMPDWLGEVRAPKMKKAA